MARRQTAAERRHLADVRALGCIVCGSPEAQAHHILEGRGSQRRVSDFETIPLCDRHHVSGGLGVAIHAGAETWRAEHGSEVALLAKVRRLLAAGAHKA